ncbi:uncharacterized protein N7500_006436 [Penicillium coprophilum]|uniref:uncharacterized protein n=1 Tax=Penicillium coprophilum TaxID=36646 RepID=UPI0023868611|nr:uncharacterized protein N7500_006436 [Penicillium coprophilum]KAJ5164606.1 hypothetical protein N7500_006436 [Penicillium coprophilum]
MWLSFAAPPLATIPTACLALLLVYYISTYLFKNKDLSDIPAASPWAALTRLWLLREARFGRRYLTIDKAHQKHGDMVRIQPNHVSIANVEAINAIYGHGNGFLKRQEVHCRIDCLDFYDAFVAVSRGLFSTRNRADHTRKRKIVSHTFAAKSVMQFEQYMHQNLNELLRQWDLICERAPANTKFARFDCLPWFAYLAFDTIGDLAFGAPFGMLRNGQDMVEYMDYPGGPSKYMRAIEALSRRGEAFAVLGCLPFLKTISHLLPDPFLRHGVRSGEQVAGIAIARVNERLVSTATNDNKRVDILARLMEGKDMNGKPLGREELTAEALTQLIAGSDTTSNTLTGVFYWLLKTPGVLQKLQAELDAVIPSTTDEISFQSVKDLPYLKSCLNEGMRIHSTSALGLPRVVPLDGLAVDICGHKFEPGTVLSVPNYTIHRLASIWGNDSNQYRPERWESLTADQKKAFVPFGHGPRSCVGRNVAEMEMTLALASLVRRFDFELYQDNFDTWEGFLRKGFHCEIGIRRRTT